VATSGSSTATGNFWKYGHRKSECKILDAEMARKGGGNGGKGKGTYELQAEGDEEKSGKAIMKENPEEEWWVAAVCALSRDGTLGFTRVDSRRSPRPRLVRYPLKGIEATCNSLASLAEDCEEEQANEEEAKLVSCGSSGIGDGLVSHLAGGRSFGEARDISTHARSRTQVGAHVIIALRLAVNF
jgi:hypothetical protein